MPMPKDKITAKEFFERVPETNELCELIGGEIVMQAAPSDLHHATTTEIFSALRDHIKSKGGRCKPYHAPFDVVLDDENVVQPDVFVVCNDDKRDGKRINGAPDLVIEVLSTNRKDDLVRKLALYQEHGVREYWIVDPENKKSLVYFFDKSDFPSIYNFDQPIPVGIYGGELSVRVNDMI